jgi:hypothetical protein
MIDTSDKYLLMIEPDKDGKPSEEPIEDELTRKVDFIFTRSSPSSYLYRGFHTTECGRRSDNKDWILPNGVIMNNLCFYYIRFYRPYIPAIEIEKIERLYTELMSPRAY